MLLNVSSGRSKPWTICLQTVFVWLIQVLVGRAADLDIGSNEISTSAQAEVPDENGYVFYCPCHGRFGNQADQFLGSLAFAKRLNRTLILPPWRTYSGKNKMVPFDEIFEVEPLRAYHRVILASKFMEELADKVWPLAKRLAFCYLWEQDKSEKPCNVESTFFAEFWEFVGAPEFAFSENIRGLTYDENGAMEWIRRYPSNLYPVIALKGPPAPFPGPLSQWPIQKYLRWSPKIKQKGDHFIASKFLEQGFIGIHLRNGQDWERACDLIKEERHGLKNLMASTQCLGEQPEAGVTIVMCLPTKEEAIQTVVEAVQLTGVKNVFVATDNDWYEKEFSVLVPEIHVVRYVPDDPMVDLYILGQSDFFIGNCVSSFSSFVRRERDVASKKTTYFGLAPSGSAPAQKNVETKTRQEL